MKKTTSVKQFLWLLVISLFFASCESKMDEHYEVPEWLKGNIWEILKEQGNYTIFLRGMEKANFKPMIDGKNIFTVMAPDDEAFSAYIKADGKSSIEDYTEEELVKLIGFHVIYYTYSHDQFTNYRPQGDDLSEEESSVNAGLYYKFRTKSSDPVSQTEIDDPANPGSKINITLYHQERMLPVFSKRMFETKRIDPKYNYEYFYPESVWTGNDDFNVSNACLVKPEQIADNGYVYYIDRVLKPLETIYKELTDRKEKFTLFTNLYDQFAVYTKDDKLTADYGQGTDLYQMLHGDLPSIACEWPSTNYQNVVTNSYTAYSIFAPSDDAFNNFFESYWKKGGYASLEEVDNTALQYLLNSHFYRGSIVFPEQITQKSLISTYDKQPLYFDVEKVSDRIICSNGVFYGLDEIHAPAIFESVTGAAFQLKDLSCYLSMLDQANMMRVLVSKESKFTALMPTDNQFFHNDIWKQNNALWTYSDVDGSVVAVSETAVNNYVSLHLASAYADLLQPGKQVVKTNSSFNYWFVKDGYITSHELFNRKIQNPGFDPFLKLKKISYNGGEWSNGEVFCYEGEEVFTQPYNESLEQLLALAVNNTLPYYEFGHLLEEAGLSSAKEKTLSVLKEKGEEEPFIVFVPTNEAIQKAIRESKIPGVDPDGSIKDKEVLAAYLSCYFIRVDDSNLSDYPYVGSGINKTCLTYAPEANGESPYRKISVLDDGERISISNQKGDQVYVTATYDQFPFVYKDGCLHFIDGVIEY